MPRPRRTGSRHLPPNLYRGTDSRNGATYYRYRDPRTGKFHGLGTDESAAIADAVALNAAIAAQLSTARLHAITLNEEKPSGPLFGEVVLQYLALAEQQHARGRLAETTLRQKQHYGRHLRDRFGKIALSSIGVRDLAEMLSERIDAGKERAAQALRSEMIEIWKTAIAEGWANDNPAAKTRPPAPQVKRARLTLEIFQTIYQRTENQWLRNAMALAIVTAQRREDIAGAQFSDVHDGGWWCVQGKTGNRVFLPLSLRLEAVGMSLDHVVRQCRQTGIVSRHLIHQTQPRGNSPIGQPIFVDTISKGFAHEIASLGIDWGEKTRPTFHEIRSLAIRLYAAQGGVREQDLAGHKDPRTTAVYRDGRGEWVMVDPAPKSSAKLNAK